MNAQVILQQLGGNRFRAMTGAKDLVAIPGGLQFRLPSSLARGGINRVVVKLNASDLYDVEYLKVRGLDAKLVAASGGVYADMLAQDFSVTTGLAVVL